MVFLRERLWIPGAFGLALAALIGLGGAAASPRGVWLGVPRLLPALAVVGAVVGWSAWTRGRPGLALGVGLLGPVALVLVGVPLAGVRALSGEPLLVLVFAGIALGLVAVGAWPPRWLFVPAVFLLYVVVAGRVQTQVGPRGDEPHYLMVAESLIRDGDLSLEADYAAGRYRAFHDAPLEPHYRVRGQNGEIISLHAVGLSLLLLPAYAAAGYVGASVFMALLAALVAAEVREGARDLTGRDGVAEAVGWTVALCPPLVHYAGLIFTEVPAALLLVVGLRRGRGAGTLGQSMVVGLCAAALPWLNVRYVPLAAILVLHAVWRRRDVRSAVALIAPGILSAVGLALYHQALYGFFDPRRVYGRRPEMALSSLGEGLPGLVLDQEFGLLVYAPVLLLAVPGLLAWWRRDRPGALAAGALVVTALLTAGSWHMWRGGFNPPGRFLVPVAPALAIAVAAAWDRRGLTAGAALMLGWSLWTGLGGGWEPRLVHRDRDGTAPFFREHSGALEWTGLLPAYVLAETDRGRLAALWAGALLLATPWRRRTPTATRLAVAGLGLVAAAQGAALLTDAHTGDRDAVRVVGRPAVRVPRLELARSAVATWDAESVEWGRVYEPHRHPSGAEVGRRLPLRPGRYELDAEGEVLGADLPRVEIVPEGSGGPRWVPLTPGEGRQVGHAPVEVREGEEAVTLKLLGGGPAVFERWHLRFNPGPETLSKRVER